MSISFHPVRSLRQAMHQIGHAVNASAELSQAARKRQQNGQRRKQRDHHRCHRHDTDDEAQEFHKFWVQGFVGFTAVAVVAHLLVWIWRPWL